MKVYKFNKPAEFKEGMAQIINEIEEKKKKSQSSE